MPSQSQRVVHRAAIALSLGVAVLLPACSAATQGTADPAPVSFKTDLPLIELTIDSAPDRQASARATETKIKDCMAKVGFEYFVNVPSATADGSDDGTRPFGPTDDAQVRLVGYHPTEAMNASDQAAQANETAQGNYVSSLPAAKQQEFQLALFGSDANRGEFKIDGVVDKTYPQSGCRAQAETDMFGDRPRYIADETQLQKLYLDAKQLTAADPQMKAALAKWSACMTDLGYDYATPSDALSKATAPGPTPTDGERSTAVADVGCKKSTGLMDTWRKVESASEHHIVDQNQAIVQDWAELRAERLKRAHDS